MRRDHMPNIIGVLTNKQGQAMTEYAILIGLIALVGIIGVQLLGISVHAMYDGIQGATI